MEETTYGQKSCVTSRVLHFKKRSLAFTALFNPTIVGYEEFPKSTVF